MPRDGEATADAVLHLASLRVDAPLLARDQLRGENLIGDDRKLIDFLYSKIINFFVISSFTLFFFFSVISRHQHIQSHVNSSLMESRDERYGSSL